MVHAPAGGLERTVRSTRRSPARAVVRWIALGLAAALLGGLLAAILAAAALLVASAALDEVGGELELEPTVEHWSVLFRQVLVPMVLVGIVTVTTISTSDARRAAGL